MVKSAMNGELLRIVDSIRREKSIDVEIIFSGIEAALISAARKHFGMNRELLVTIDRETGNIAAALDGVEISAENLGRIAAQTAKQVIIQKIREAEREVILQNYTERIGTIVSGQVSRIEHGSVIVNLGKVEAFLPRREQIPGETFHVASRIRCLILEVRPSGGTVRIIVSRGHVDFIKQLFDQEVPEIADHTIEIRAIAREPGHRTKVAVSSLDSRVDAVGACVGVRGTRIKNIVEEVGGEKIDIVRWNDAPPMFIGNALKPAEVVETFRYRDIGRAVVLVNEDQLSLAIGKKGQNVRLAARLTGWNIDIMTPLEFDQERRETATVLEGLETVGPELAPVIVDGGLISLADVAEASPEVLAGIAGLDEEQAVVISQQVEEILKQREAQAAEEARAAEEAQAAKEAQAAEEAQAAKEAQAAEEAQTAEEEQTEDAAEPQEAQAAEEAQAEEQTEDAAEPQEEQAEQDVEGPVEALEGDPGQTDDSPAEEQDEVEDEEPPADEGETPESETTETVA
ncbi:MAG: transcription termination factor NusA [Planctomycetia bacterium]|nr:transcription termination factor NusA [Planctomycetia bacterium]